MIINTEEWRYIWCKFMNKDMKNKQGENLINKS